jgi:hypothetical protein
MNKTPEELIKEREQRINNVVALREPDRVPVYCLPGFFPAKYAGITCKTAMYDDDQAPAAWTKYLEDFHPDLAPALFTPFMFVRDVLDVLDCRQALWPGHGVGDSSSMQYPDEVRERCRKVIDYVGKGGGFIMSSSTVLDDARVENVRAMFEFTRGYGVYR